MSPLWSNIVIALVILNILACLWLLIWTSKKRPNEAAEGAETGHVWDDDLREYNNPLPRWWLNMFVLTIIFGLGYLVFYPGLGNFAGRLGWTSKGQMEQRLAEVQQRRNALYAAFDGQPVAALQTNTAAMALGAKLFSRNCAGCHGTDAQGAVGFPNLTDNDWLYGGSEAQVHASINNGRRGQMPSFVGSVDEQQVSDLVAYVQALHQRPEAASELPGAKKFSVTCVACHGAEAHGNQALGAPDLTDAVWLHGGDTESIRQTIVLGRSSEMPTFKDQLSETERQLLTAYVLSLSGNTGQQP